jgi:hypothetical protein
LIRLSTFVVSSDSIRTVFSRSSDGRSLIASRSSGRNLLVLKRHLGDLGSGLVADFLVLSSLTTPVSVALPDQFCPHEPSQYQEQAVVESFGFVWSPLSLLLLPAKYRSILRRGKPGGISFLTRNFSRQESVMHGVSDSFRDTDFAGAVIVLVLQ